MKQLFFYSVFICISFIAHAQTVAPSFPYTHSSKPLLDSSVYRKWIWVSGAAITNNGQYASYTINNQPYGDKTTIIQATMHDWKLELPYIENVTFTADGKQAIYLNKGDSLCLIDLKSNIFYYVPKISSFKLAKSIKGEWLIYQEKVSNRLVMRDLANNEEHAWAGITSYWLSSDGKTLVVQMEDRKSGILSYVLKWIDVEQNLSFIIYEGEKVLGLYFDHINSQIAFSTERSSGKYGHKTIWYYQKGKPKSTLLISDSSGIDNDVTIESICAPGFDKSDTKVFVNLRDKELPPLSADQVQVNVWHYKDAKLQPEQIIEMKPSILRPPNRYLSVVHLNNKKIIRLAHRNERVYLNENTNQYGILHNDKVSSGEYWHPENKSSFVISLDDGRDIFEIKKQYSSIGFSPQGNYFVYYDSNRSNYFSVELSTGIIKNLTKGIGIDFLDRSDDDVIPRARAIAAWLSNDSAVFVYDKYDIWQLDPTGVKRPLNITKSYGKKNNVVFRFAFNPAGVYIIDKKQPKVLLSAFNVHNKNNGFYFKYFNDKGNLDSLTMGKYLYDLSWKFIGSVPQKARDSDTWIISRQNAYESPNYFSTSDFKSFRRLSNVNLENNYNWYRTELHTWKAPNGKTLQGILYKPENFDSSKKYPIIFHYYEKRSFRLNIYIRPEPSDGDLNIPWYVSNGYLVFEPDIHYTIGYPGESALASVESAAKYMSRFTYINAGKMGIQGISFGGFETGYIVTHSNLFAAACASAGIYNQISHYGSLTSIGSSMQSINETGQNRIGNSLFERPDLYIKNSSIFQLNRVSTPILMMHVTNDGVCPFSNAVEFFTGLRRLQKRCWMLQYNEGNHGVRGKAAEDFTIRMSQFFDHLLKDKPAPVWMTKGISAKDKGFDNGLKINNNKE